MKDSLKEKWLHLYFLAQEIGRFEPWKRFGEDNRFAYVWKDNSKTVLFTFLSESSNRCGIAVYIGEENYIRARQRLRSKNEKHEPVFMLQNALIAIWGNRADVSRGSYDIIKELGLKFRGNGSWLFFERYEVGYLPVPVSENEIDLLITAYENLHMMLRAIYEDGLNPEFDKGNSLLRWYDKKAKLYYTHPFKVDMNEELIQVPVATVYESEGLQRMRDLRTSDYKIELDWSYLNDIYSDDDGRDTFPLALICTEKSSGFVIISSMLSPETNKPNAVLGSMFDLISKHGKPSEICICDAELYGILYDFCKKIAVKLTMRKRLPAVKKARDELLLNRG